MLNTVKDARKMCIGGPGNEAQVTAHMEAALHMLQPAQKDKNRDVQQRG